MQPKAYTIVFTPRYSVNTDTFTLTGDLKALAYELTTMLENLPVTDGPWQVKEDEEIRHVINPKRPGHDRLH